MGKKTLCAVAISLILFCTASLNCQAQETAMAKEDLNMSLR